MVLIILVRDEKSDFLGSARGIKDADARINLQASCASYNNATMLPGVLGQKGSLYFLQGNHLKTGQLKLQIKMRQVDHWK